MRDEKTAAAVEAARVLVRNLTRIYGRGLVGHELSTVQAHINLRMALDALDALDGLPADGEQERSP